MEIKRTQPRYALLLAAHDSEYVKKAYGGYFNVFVAAFGEEGESWDLYRVVEGEFPDMDELDNYDGFVVSGSPFDAYANDFWILKLCLLLRTLDAMQKKVLGICFGHQVCCFFIIIKASKLCLSLHILDHKKKQDDKCFVTRHFLSILLRFKSHITCIKFLKIVQLNIRKV